MVVAVRNLHLHLPLNNSNILEKITDNPLEYLLIFSGGKKIVLPPQPHPNGGSLPPLPNGGAALGWIPCISADITPCERRRTLTDSFGFFPQLCSGTAAPLPAVFVTYTFGSLIA